MAGTHTPATSVLGSMLAGLSATTVPGRVDAPSLSVEEMTADGDYAVAATLVLPSGDKYLVRVEWLRAESP